MRVIALMAQRLRESPPPEVPGGNPWRRFGPFRSILEPHSLDDSGAMGAAMIKATRAGVHPAEL